MMSVKTPKGSNLPDDHWLEAFDVMDEMGILSVYTGIAKHDFWKAYLKYLLCGHSLCNAHHLRELTWVIENENQSWAQQMNRSSAP